MTKLWKKSFSKFRTWTLQKTAFAVLQSQARGKTLQDFRSHAGLRASAALQWAPEKYGNTFLLLIHWLKPDESKKSMDLQQRDGSPSYQLAVFNASLRISMFHGVFLYGKIRDIYSLRITLLYFINESWRRQMELMNTAFSSAWTNDLSSYLEKAKITVKKMNKTRNAVSHHEEKSCISCMRKFK